jgi:hypothetical protein
MIQFYGLELWIGDRWYRVLDGTHRDRHMQRADAVAMQQRMEYMRCYVARVVPL